MSDNHPQKKSSESQSNPEEDFLEDINPDLLKGIPKNKKLEIASYILSVQRTHSGPLPSPDYLEEYSRIIPNGAERIMQMAEKQSEHRMKMENKALSSHVNQGYLGQIFGFIIGLAFLSAGVYLGINGQPILGGTLGLGGLTGLVTAFIKGRDSDREEVSEKSKTVKK